MDNEQRSPFDEPELETIHRGLHFPGEGELEPPPKDGIEEPDQVADEKADERATTSPVEGETDDTSSDGKTPVFGSPPISRLPLEKEE
jgi:hypothetical protein